MRRRRRAKLISDINVVPYLDVMLVLLVIFMITAPLFNQGVVDLPSVGDTPLEGLEGFVVNYSLDERFSFGGEEGERTSLSQEEMIDGIITKLFLEPKESVIIASDKEISFQKVMSFYGKLLNELESRGVPHKGRIGFSVTSR